MSRKHKYWEGLRLKITFWGGARTVTGSCYLLEIGETRILVDCGMFQGNKKLTVRNERNFPFQPHDIDYILLTHAHIDHSGLIPKLCKNGFKGVIYTTEATLDLCAIMLPDSGHIQEMEAEWKTRKANRRGGKSPIQPIYTMEDAVRALRFFRTVRYDEELQVTSQIRCRFRDAGHILGSSIIEIWVQEDNDELKLVFSGDLGKNNQPIINDPTPIDTADYVFVESTYGQRNHENEDKIDRLKGIIHNTVNRGGRLVIPAFAVGRTQMLMYYLNNMLNNHEIPQIPIFLDSPMAIEATKVFARHPELYDQEARGIYDSGDMLFQFPGLQLSKSTEESMAINRLETPAIIISASGMADAGRILHHLKHNLWRPESTVLFVGYQAEGSLGRRLVDGATRVRIFGEEIIVRAKIESIDGFSAHADQQGLMDWMRQIKQPKLAFLIHGEDEAMQVFAEKLENDLALKNYTPHYGDAVTLDRNGWQVAENDYRKESAVDNHIQELHGMLAEVDDTYKRYHEQMEHAIAEDPRQMEVVKHKLAKIQRYIQKTLGSS
jgi:metallo-beta-lactamase family protein